jgi:hypothetical protein
MEDLDKAEKKQPKPTPKRYSLMGVDENYYDSPVPGTLAGNRKLKIYGQLNCGLPSCGFPDRGLPPDHKPIRVYFADEETAIAAGYRPCGGCMPERYKQWKQGPQPGKGSYPWHVGPPPKKQSAPSPDAKPFHLSKKKGKP